MREETAQPTSPGPSGATPTARTPSNTARSAQVAPESQEVAPGTSLLLPDPEPEGVAAAETSAQGYHTVDWGGRVMFQCDRCPYNSFTENRMPPHVKSHR